MSTTSMHSRGGWGQRPSWGPAYSRGDSLKLSIGVNHENRMMQKKQVNQDVVYSPALSVFSLLLSLQANRNVKSPAILSNVQDPSSGAPVTEYYRNRIEVETRLAENSKHRLEAIEPIDSMMAMDVDHNQEDSREISTLIEARKFSLPPKRRHLVEKILSGPHDDFVVIDKFNIDMTRSKISCLRNRTWLNDEVINFYMSMLQERDDRLCKDQSDRLSSHYFNSFFMSKLLEKGKYTYSNVRRWTKKFDVLSKDKIFFPVNIGNTHWALAVVYVKRKEIVYFDSMKRDGFRYLQALAKWFQEDVMDKKETDVDTTKWTLRSESNAPQQRNGYDCGVFAITFADFLSDDLPLQFNQQDITENRFRFTSSILAGSLQY